MSARRPADQSARDRVTTDFETTLLLEAGAGTGKTTVLVKRILALLRAEFPRQVREFRVAPPERLQAPQVVLRAQPLLWQIGLPKLR